MTPRTTRKDKRDEMDMHNNNTSESDDFGKMIMGDLSEAAAHSGPEKGLDAEEAGADAAMVPSSLTHVIGIDDRFRLLPSVLPLDGGIAPSPRQPDAVARLLLYWYAEAGVHLKHWRDDWYLWREGRTGGAYRRLVGADNRYAVSDSVRSVLSDARYRASGKDGPEFKDWAPTRATVGEVVEAMAAQSRPSEELEAGTWLVCVPEREAATPGRDLVCVANGLLYSPGVRNGLATGAEDVMENTRVLLEHTPEFFTDTAVAVDWNPEAACPRWTQFLQELWPGDEDSQRLLQEWFGYVIAGDTALQKMLTLVGPPRSGKGTIVWVMEQLLGGSGQVDHPTMASLATNFGLAGMLGKRLAVIGDARIAKSDPAIVERLLMISGEDPITIDRKHQSPIVAKLDARIVILSNDMPDLRDVTGALASRIMPLATEASFLGKEDLGLKEKLGGELPGVLRWALEGAERLRASGGRFTVGDAVRKSMQAVRRASSPIMAFAEDCLVFTEEGDHIAKDELYAFYAQWTTDAGYGVKGKNVFFRELKAAYPGKINTDAKLPPSQGRTPVAKGVRFS